MTDHYLAGHRGGPIGLNLKVEGMPAPVFNTYNNITRSNRVEALYAALEYHRDHPDEETLPTAEEVCGTAQCFEYFLDKGEFPAG